MEEMLSAGVQTANMVDGDVNNPVGADTVVTAEELYSEMSQQDAPDQTDTGDGVVGQQTGEEQKDIGEAFAKEKRRIEAQTRRRYEAEMRQHEPAINLGTRLIQDVMQMHGVSAEVAAQIAEQNLLKAVAAREGVSPNMARVMFSNNPAISQPQQQEAPAQMAARIREDVALMDLPDGFNFDDAVQDEEFCAMLMEMPTARAVQLYHAQGMASKAPQDIAEKLRGRQALPIPGKPQQPVMPKVDFDSMSDEEFRKFKNGKHNAEMNGKKVRI